jgi:hypothetical protein
MKTPPHNHDTIGEAGACPECRAFNIDAVKDGPWAFLLAFSPTASGDAPAASLVRSWSPDGSFAADTAWATGCNLPRCVFVQEIPVGVAVESGVEMFRLHHGREAAAAVDAIRELMPGAPAA